MKANAEKSISGLVILDILAVGFTEGSTCARIFRRGHLIFGALTRGLSNEFAFP